MLELCSLGAGIQCIFPGSLSITTFCFVTIVHWYVQASTVNKCHIRKLMSVIKNEGISSKRQVTLPLLIKY